MPNFDLEYKGVPINKLYDDLIKTGISHHDAAVIAGNWILDNVGYRERTFQYAEAFAAVEPNCVSKFQRSFDHKPWTDGEDVVQAGETTGDKGFNWRFDRIKEDLDLLSRDMANAYTCIAAMRASLKKLLEEIRLEINRINSDVHECCRGGIRPMPLLPGTPFPVEIPDRFGVMGNVNIGGIDYGLYQTDKGFMALPLMRVINPVVNPRAEKVRITYKHIEESREIREFMRQPGGFTKKDLVTKFGNDRTSEGALFKQVIDILPDEIKFENEAKFLEELTDREAAAIRTEGDVDAAITLMFGAGVDRANVDKASVDRMIEIPSNVRTVLIKYGIDTVSKLAETSPEELNRLMTREGIRGSGTGDAAGWVATAKTINRLARS